MRYFIAVTLAMAMRNAAADWTASLEQAWDRTKSVSGELYQTTRDVGERAWGATLGLFTNSQEEQAKSRLDHQDAAFRKTLAETLTQLEQGVAIIEEQESAPDRAFFRKDKADFQEDFNDLLDNMTAIFEDNTIIRSRERIFSLRQGIAETRQRILKLKEQQLAAPRHHRVQTTKQDYEDQIAEQRQIIVDQQAEIEAISWQFIEKLSTLGVTLTPAEVEVLLARVDSRDIVQMAVVFHTAKKIDAQLLTLMADSGENVGHAKRYYGMHVVLLELVRYMQDTYLADIDRQYVPQLKMIIAKTKALYQSSKAAFEEDEDEHRRRGYAANMRANQLTIDTAELYIKLLETQRGRVATARERVQSDLRLAKNTYATVRYSAELLAILQTSRHSFDTLMGLQVPAMEPFTNLRMQREFEALSRRIATRG
jgi:hypothetical protein